MTERPTKKSSTRRLRRTLRRSLGSGGGGRALGVLAAVAVATAGIVLSTGTGPAAAAPDPTTTTTTTTTAPPGNPTAPTNGAVSFSQGPVSGTAALAQSGILVGSPQQLLVDIDLKAHGEANHRRVPVAMALVLDRSGSMSGAKIAQAKRSVLQALERMQDDDYFGFVAYDHTAQTLVPLQQVGPNRGRIRGIVENVRSGGGTQVPQGLDQGFQTLSNAPPGYARRVVLVSDGIDGSGVGPDGIRRSVARFGESGVTVAALGIGTDYDEAFLTAVADAGNGAYAYLRQGSELQAFLNEEMRAASAMVAERLAFELALPPRTRFVRVHGATAEHMAGGVRLQAGNMASGDQRHIVVELQSTAQTAGPLGGVGVTLGFHDRTADQRVRALAGALQVHGVTDAVLAEASRNAEHYAAANAVLLEASQAEAMDRWRSGDVEGAVQMAQQNAAGFGALRAYAPDSPVLAEQEEAAEEDAAQFTDLEPTSAGGRGYSLGSNAARRSRSTGL